MTSLVRFISRPGGNVDPAQDRLFEDGELWIGRVADNAIQLLDARVAAHHAVARPADGGFAVEATPGAALSQRGAATGRAMLGAPGDEVVLGPYTLSLGTPTEAAHRVLIITAGASQEVDETALTDRYQKAFDAKLPLIGPWALGLGVLVLLLGFILPLGMGASETGNAAKLPIHRFIEPAALWNVGTMSSAHAAFGTDCKSCHRSPFQRVTAEACLTCHATIGQHADPHVAAGVDLTGERCETCHHEHKGMQQVIDSDQHFCVSCHGSIKGTAPNTALLDVGDFGSDHPEFAPALVADAALKTRIHYRLGDASAIDHGNLKFPHAKHLKAEGVKSPNGPVVLTCATCHRLDADGAYMKPISFERDCKSCHQLQFEPKHPEWRLPHGQPNEVASEVLGLYSGAILHGEGFDRQRDELFAKPGAAPLKPEDMPEAAARAQASLALASSIARSTCGGCHVTTPPAPGADPMNWRVEPVFVPSRYFTQAKFSHAKHDTLECTQCHAAALTDDAALDTGAMKLLPGIATCRTCHTGESGGTQRVASTCVTCHDFHDSDLPLRRPTAMRTAALSAKPEAAP